MNSYTSDKFQIDASNAFPLTTPKITEPFGSNINIGSNFVDSNDISINTINKSFNIISGQGTSTLTISTNDISNLDKIYDIGGSSSSSKIIYNNVLGEYSINDINTTHTVIDTNTNDFTISLGTTSSTDSVSFGGSNVVINKFVGVTKNFLNNTHLVKSIVDSNNFKIELGTFSNTNYENVGGTNLSLSLDTVDNISLNTINAIQPRDVNHIYGYQTIHKIDSNNIKIILPQKFNIDKTFGGNNVIVKKITDFIKGYSNQNNYEIQLDRKYENIYKVELISSEFVNSEVVIKGSSFGTSQNNLIKFQIENDSTIYNQELIEGNYDSNTFPKMIQEELSKMVTLNNESLTFECEVNVDTGKLTIKNFIKVNLSKPFTVTTGSNIITVTHLNHGFSTGEIIKILNSTNVDTIVSTDINKREHSITVINSNKYSFKVGSISINNSTNRGGKTVQILKPKNFKLLFTLDNSASKLFGFLKTDTIFSSQHTGTRLVDLSGDDYFYMCSPQLGDTVKDDGIVEDIFAKIL